MGIYLERDDGQPHGKAEWLLKHVGAVELSKSDMVKVVASMRTIPLHMMLVCVVDNGPFEAAGIVYDKAELNAFAKPDGRPKRWLLVPKGEIIKQRPFLRECVEGREDWRAAN